MLLTTNPFPFAQVQCAVFKGDDRVVFVDKREYEGPLYEQFDEAVNFVLRNIHLGAEIKGKLRMESYELPPEAIREAIVNAIIHRRIGDTSRVQVAIYDNRLEVTSPGALFAGLTMDEAMTGATKLRNPLLAKVFQEMELFESWGTGIKRIQDTCAEYGLPAPEFQEIGNTFRVNIFRAPAPKAAPKAAPKIGSGSFKGNPAEAQQEIVKLMKANPGITRQELADALQVSLTTIRKHIADLRNLGIVSYEGSAKSGIWIVKQ
jgi:predicted HTH transcriptional regulator